MPKQRPSIDIAMPIGHWSPHLVAALTSLKNQSIGFSLAILDASDDPRVKADIKASGLSVTYARHGPDGGQAAAIAEGWANTNSEIVAWLNGDDMLMPNILETVSSFFADAPDIDAFYGQSTISREDGAILGLHPEVEAPSDLLLRTNIISQPSCFIRRTALEDVGGLDVSLHYTMDWDLWIRLFQAKKVFQYTRQILSNVTWYPDTKTSSASSARLKEIFTILRRNHSLYVTMKGMFGLLVHHVQIYAFKGKAGLGELRTPVTDLQNFPVLNVTSKAQNKLCIQVSSDASSIVCQCKDADIEYQDKQMIVHSKTPVFPGEVLSIQLQTSPNNRSNFVRSLWMN